MRMLLVAAFFTIVAAGSAAFAADGAASSPKIRVLIVDGQNNHAWQKTTPLLKAALEEAGLFTVDVATSPPSKQKMDDFKPDFAKYQVVVSNYNGDDWAEPTRKALESFVANGGGFVSYHAADNSFPKWPEYNKMIGVGGWGNRNEKSGPMLRFRDGKIVRDETKGGRGGHGKRHEFVVETRDPEHPIMKGLPARWLHTADELYATLGGPAENVTVLATAFSKKESGGTGENEPMLMAITYGKGRVFHTTLGHDETAIKDVGFVATFCRGTEWAATGKVSQKVPENFPTETKTSTWEPRK
jgi:type 1 glutamine amidotransferase